MSRLADTSQQWKNRNCWPGTFAEFYRPFRVTQIRDTPM